MPNMTGRPGPQRMVGHEKRAQTQTFESDTFRWGKGLPQEGVGAIKLGMSLENREIKLFRSPRILLGYPRGARKV